MNLYVFMIVFVCGVEVLDLMGKMSQRAKKDGYIVAMAPMESYLDPSTSLFSL